MDEVELIQEICKRGTASVKEDDRISGRELEGSLEGFRLAAACDSIDGVAAILQSTHTDVEFFRRLANEGKYSKESFWYHRYIEIQLEHVFEVLKVGHPETYHNVYASKVLYYHQLVSAEP